MGEILPDGKIQGYSNICTKCGNRISVNLQGDEIGNHACKKWYHVYDYCKECEHRNDKHGMNCMECCPVKNNKIKDTNRTI